MLPQWTGDSGPCAGAMAGREEGSGPWCDSKACVCTVPHRARWGRDRGRGDPGCPAPLGVALAGNTNSGDNNNNGHCVLRAPQVPDINPMRKVLFISI